MTRQPGDEEPVLGSCKAGKPRVRRDLYEGGRPSVCAGGPGKPRTPGRPGAGAHFWNCAGKGGASRGGRLASSGAHCLGGSWQARPPVRELAEGWVSQGLAAPGLAHGVGEQEQTLESSAALCQSQIWPQRGGPPRKSDAGGHPEGTTPVTREVAPGGGGMWALLTAPKWDPVQGSSLESEVGWGPASL